MYGVRYVRSGECCHCGECCVGCALRDAAARRCTGHGGETYRGYGCDTWPDPTAVLPAACTYRFQKVGG